MKTVKIAHVSTVDISLRDLLLNQLQYLAAAGYEVSGIATMAECAPALEAAGVRPIHVPMSRKLTPFADLRSLAQLWRVMRRERFTLVHTHTPKAGLLGQLAARLAGVPFVVNTVHGFYFHEHMPPAARRFYILLERIAARCSNLVLSQNAEDIRAAFEERICRPGQIEFLGNGIDLGRFDPARIDANEQAAARARLGLPAGAPVIGFVGRLAARRKGFLDFLAAARIAAAHRPDVHFLILGAADLGKPDAVEPERAQEYGIAAQCHFPGLRPNEELPLYYSLMDLLVLPSLFEGVPRVVMEASAMGVPTVASNVKGNREAVFEGRNGWLVPFGNVPALGKAMLRVLNDPETARRIREQCRPLALEHFDEQEVFQKVKASYARLLAGQKPKVEEESPCAGCITRSGGLRLK